MCICIYIYIYIYIRMCDVSSLRHGKGYIGHTERPQPQIPDSIITCIKYKLQ